MVSADGAWVYAFPVALIQLPCVIDGPGQYLTRSGEEVTIDWVDCFVTPLGPLPHTARMGCHGTYSCGTRERWHLSGRVHYYTQTPNDIVQRAPNPPQH